MPPKAGSTLVLILIWIIFIREVEFLHLCYCSKPSNFFYLSHEHRKFFENYMLYIWSYEALNLSKTTLRSTNYSILFHFMSFLRCTHLLCKSPDPLAQWSYPACLLQWYLSFSCTSCFINVLLEEVLSMNLLCLLLYSYLIMDVWFA